MNKDLKKHRKHNNNNKTGMALLLILIGGIFLAFNMGIIPPILKSIIISWQMLLIALGIGSFLKKQPTGGLVLILIGGIFLLPKIGRIFPDFLGGIHINISILWPIILIAIGIALLIKRSSNRHNYNDEYDTISDSKKNTREYEDIQGGYNSNNKVEENVIFGSSERIIFSDKFEGGDINVMFGEIKLDLRRSSLSYEPLPYLEANSLFGSIIIYVPANWKLHIKRESLFGSVQDKRIGLTNSTDPNAPVFKIKGSSLFGSIEIRD
ncbi:hypothetical protein D0T53_03570 [Dysgonomonas sp. 216]|uniref:LiaF transmembrane domain-containing protein n=1 Tax=Dysgonomonas sp. 216 TaxID=2302934 RepID=UPI0013D149DC|nr:DUF5668 domain-containing protein [Dysgonomonas sp. 216]NDW17994.1 hypothetical protein [Dysgonomonas sp. 216]